MNAQFSALLDQLPEEQLRSLLRSVYGLDLHVDRRIETGLLAGDGEALVKHLKEQVQLLDDSQRTVEWGRSGTFNRKLDELLAEINKLVADYPREAFELVDMFMNTYDKVYKRCEDSDSGIGGTYYAAMQLWLQAAEAWQKSAQPCRLEWHEEILKRHLNNSNAVWDHLVTNSQSLLGAEKLKQLALAFQREIKKMPKTPVSGDFDYLRATAEAGLRSVAEALGDVSLFEWSYLNSGKSLNEIQKEQIAKFCLAHDDGEAALRWVVDQWQWCEDQRLKLLDQSYSALGRFSDLLQLRRAAYKADPSQYRLADLLEVEPESEHSRINAEAIEKAAQSSNITAAVNTLLSLQSPESASEYILTHPERLSDASTLTLADWGAGFEDSGHPLAAVLCYRILLLNILETGRSKAYPQAAQCHASMRRIEARVDDFLTFKSADEFEAELRKIHGRKRAFWNLLR